MAKVEKLQKRFDATFADRNFYEAHQIARTIFFRQLEAEKFDELARFLCQKALDFVDVGEDTSALDLAELFAQTLTKGALFNKLPPRLRSATESDAKSGDARTPFANRLIRWSAQVAPPAERKPNQLPGDSRLLQIVAPMALQQAADEEESMEEESAGTKREMIDNDELD
ncbi:hypothetical protein M3Y99_00623500 [Aphelenchoides fujianensis]|nr:hypothetical protein M3Y99_00623500 [Aphelenchoides fujianensis]